MTKLRTGVDYGDICSISIDFDEWLMRSTCPLSQFVAETLRSHGVRADDKQIHGIAAGLDDMARSVVDDEEAWVARILRRNGITVHELVEPETEKTEQALF
ncbi:hypothetical protein [Saccharopolyspora pogona]|uniref:hypothetical protein n=1 Tax=Saccharopolyspora pogona TaxID=333966 RepID=UPI001686E834|nr:hypothetical protein [Saccharopolyspora pogona]